MDKKIEEQMTKNLVTISLGASMNEAYRLMYQKKIRHLPVVNDEGRLSGILSDRDIQRAMRSEVKDVFGMKLESVTFSEGARVNDYMTWPAKTISHELTVSVVIEKILEDKVSAYLISDDEKVVGIITTDDLLRMLLDLIKEKPGLTTKLQDLLSSGFLGRVGQTISDIGI